MNDGKPNEDDKGKSPLRVPLLEDVFKPGEPANKHAGKNGSRNHSLAPSREPEPDPVPTTASELSADEAAGKEPSPAPANTEAGPSDEDREEVGKGVKLDPYIREWLLENAKSTSEENPRGIDREAILRAGADLMVENLIKEYSQEIVKRLRKELTSLLDELDIDEEKSGDD